MTIEELYNKVMSDRDIMSEFVKASGTGMLTSFAESYDCKATGEELRKYFMEKCSGKNESEGALDDDDVETVAGGMVDFGKWASDLFVSAFGRGGSGDRAVLGGGIVRADTDLPKSSIVGKGIAPATGGFQKSGIVKKL